MSNLLIRKLERKIWLDKQISENIGGLQADSLKNFRTSNNSLSIFQFDQRNISEVRILAAIASGRDSIAEVDYAIFESNILEQIPIVVEKSKGDTADDLVNDFHIDLVKLTANQICSLAKFIQYNGELKRIPKQKIKNALVEGLSNGSLIKENVNQKLIPKIENLLSSRP